jgi:hypothetical protein
MRKLLRSLKRLIKKKKDTPLLLKERALEVATEEVKELFYDVDVTLSDKVVNADPNEWRSTHQKNRWLFNTLELPVRGTAHVQIRGHKLWYADNGTLDSIRLLIVTRDVSKLNDISYKISLLSHLFSVHSITPHEGSPFLI